MKHRNIYLYICTLATITRYAPIIPNYIDIAS